MLFFYKAMKMYFRKDGELGVQFSNLRTHKIMEFDFEEVEYIIKHGSQILNMVNEMKEVGA